MTSIFQKQSYQTAVSAQSNASEGGTQPPAEAGLHCSRTLTQQNPGDADLSSPPPSGPQEVFLHILLFCIPEDLHAYELERRGQKVILIQKVGVFHTQTSSVTDFSQNSERKSISPMFSFTILMLWNRRNNSY